MSLQHGNMVRLTQHIQNRMSLLNLTHVDQFLHRLEVEGPERDGERMLLAETLSTRETFFMRDAGQIRLLRETLLPRLIAQRRERGELQLRLWSCACATGEEPYSLAILLLERLPDFADWSIELNGTDISRTALQKAQTASYGNWAFRGCDAKFRQQYFDVRGHQWTLCDPVRNMVKFMQLDLLHDRLPAPALGLAEMDLILCRNLFIYLQPAAIKTAAEKLADCLREDGLLVTGHGELRTIQCASLQTEVHPESIIYRKDTAALSTDSPPVSVREKSPHPAGARPSARRPDAKHEMTDDVPPDSGHGVRDTLQRSPSEPADELAAGWRLADAGRLEEARALCQRLQARDPMVAELHLLAAAISMDLNERTQARECLRKALYLEPDMIAARQMLERLQTNASSKRKKSLPTTERESDHGKPHHL